MDCTVLFADVAGSTALYEVLGDERAFALVARCLATMSECTAAAGGRVVKTIGDAVMAVFSSADAAADAAAEMQLRVAGLGTADGVTLAVRIGLHHGPVVERDGDVFGDTVNLAARLCDQASRGQTITDRATVARLSAPRAATLRELFSVPLKGKEQEVALVELQWQPVQDEMATIMVTAAARVEHLARLDLTLGQTRIVLGPERRKVTIGRDHQADFTIGNPNVSRLHATIERRRERFVLADHSLNGTYVTLEGEPELLLRREELPLVGHGWIAFGQPRGVAEQVIEFHRLGAGQLP